MRRSEIRKIERRKARRKARAPHGQDYTQLKDSCDIFSGDMKKISLLKAGHMRHQPRRVRAMVLGKRGMLTRAQQEANNMFVDSILKATFGIVLGGNPEEILEDLKMELRGEKQKPYPDKIPEDPLPDHEPDKYWSGYRSRWPFGKDKETEYAEGREAIADMAIRHRESYPFKFRTSTTIELDSAEDFRKYIERVYTTELIIPDGDNRIRYQLLGWSRREDPPLGMLCCRCGDCGKIAAGLLHGNPDMGDPAYQTMHRKDWFCCNFGWTFMGGHGYPGGRRMICPECSKVYAEKEAKA